MGVRGFKFISLKNYRRHNYRAIAAATENEAVVARRPPIDLQEIEIYLC
jgi:hypothetical protein